MRPGGIILLLLFLASFFQKVSAQEYKQLDSLVSRADSFYSAKNYDSSLANNLKALQWIRNSKQGNYTYLLSAQVMLNIGRCYKKRNEPENAHRFLTFALRQSRANKINVDIETAFVELNDLHRSISINNQLFNYPAIEATEETSMYFPITKVEVISKDSIRITIQGGKYDGITDSVRRGGIYSKYEAKDKERPIGLVNCYPREVGNNYTIAHATNDTLLQVFPGDLVELKTRVPVSWKNLAIYVSAIRYINFQNNYKEPIYNSRYLYYYADSMTNDDIARIMKSQVDEVAQMLAEDTTAGGYNEVKGIKGIFAGETLVKAMANTTDEHLKLFLDFVNAFPRKYMGTPYKFSETYATWVISNTPMDPAVVSSFLIKQPTSIARKKMAGNLSKDITDNELIVKWFNEGMLMANADNIDSAQYMAKLIQDASTALNDKTNEGWATYLSGFIEKKLGNYKIADSSFKKSIAQFKQSGNKEGEDWAISAVANLRSSEQIKVSVQTGHLFPYIIAISPNSRFMATGGTYDKFIKIWDVTLGREIATFTAHTSDINALQYSPNGRYLVSTAYDSTIKIWNAYDYSLIKTIKTKRPELAVIFTPDSKQLVAGGRDSLVKFYDISTGAVVKTLKQVHKASVTGLAFSPANSDVLFSCGSDSMLYKWDLSTGDWDRWYKEKGRIMVVWVSNNGRYMCSLSSDSMANVWDLENKKRYFRIKVHAKSNGYWGTFAGPAFSPDSKTLALALAADTLCIVNLATLKERNYLFSSTEGYGLFDVTFSPDGNYLAGRLDIGGPIRIFNFANWDFESNSSLSHKDIKTYYTLPLSIQFTKDDNELAIVHDGISKVNLKNGSTSFLYYGALSFQNNYILLNKENIGIYTDTELPSLKFFDYINKEFIGKVSLPDSTEKLTHFELTADNKYVFLGGDKGTIAGFELKSYKKIFSNIYNHSSSSSLKGFTALRYDSTRQRLFAREMLNRILVIDIKNGSVLDSIMIESAMTLQVTPKFVYIPSAGGQVYKYDAATFKLLKKIKIQNSKELGYNSVMSYDYRYLVVQIADKFITLDTKTDKVLYEKYDHDYENGMMAISHNNKMLATGGFDCKVNMYDLATGNKIATIFTPRGKDFMIADSKGNYLAPKNTLDAVTFNYNNNSYGFEQFDTRFNRPDLVLKQLGRADSSLITSYYAAYKKRLKKLNINESTLGSDVHLPVVRLKDRFTVKPATSLSEYEMEIECYDAKYPLQSLQVLVNNSPVFGTTGKTISGNVNRTTLKVKVPLSTDKNLVKVYCTNSKGATSLTETIEISSSYKPATPSKTYFIGIAVSNYKDTSMNLRFAAKDVRDLAASFGKMYKTNFEADTLIDSRATKENILALRDKLMKTTVNDKVIISVNGHGLLSDSLDFYYATHDIDFKKPTEKGLKYEDLEALLDGIPARKKLLLIDACHSGALDKEEMLAQQKQVTTIKDTATDNGSVSGFASRGLIVKDKKGAVDANSSYEVMQNLFADISSGNGAVVISAAGGMEYAFESEKWNNGVFTYCIRKGIEEDMADKEGGNADRRVDVVELKNYVSKKVSELTKGKQRPVSRRENIEFNWVVW
ncbi:hypothetical protein CAP36_04985 [Chitinophagaceae bacterium IBVUCB2]|nr:hypothetical protein CAP36_04985 [Chitinophagaceae bacterium IBVUCB2]